MKQGMAIKIFAWAGQNAKNYHHYYNNYTRRSFPKTSYIFRTLKIKLNCLLSHPIRSNAYLAKKRKYIVNKHVYNIETIRKWGLGF